jgi:hypothetical protein
MDADAELDAAFRRKAGIALDHSILYFDGAAHGIDDAAEFNESAVASTLECPPIMDGDGGIDEVAAQRSQSRQGAILVRSCQSAETDDIGGKNRGKLSGLSHRIPP